MDKVRGMTSAARISRANGVSDAKKSNGINGIWIILTGGPSYVNRVRKVPRLCRGLRLLF